MKKVLDLAKRLFFSGKGSNIFCHEAKGELCAVCNKPMQTKQKITKVGSGEKMHSSCWGDFFQLTIDRLKT